jgi:hypothetical protein
VPAKKTRTDFVTVLPDGIFTRFFSLFFIPPLLSVEKSRYAGCVRIAQCGFARRPSGSIDFGTRFGSFFIAHGSSYNFFQCRDPHNLPPNEIISVLSSS